MATDAGIASVLAFLHELFPTREVSPATLDAWSIVFAEWPDEQLRSCAAAAAKESGRTFFPTPGEIAAHRALPPIDADSVLERIAKLGYHNPRDGWIYPSVPQIRSTFGDAVANAYIAAGSSLCFANDQIGRDIARRKFADDLTAAQRRSPDRPLLAPAAPPALQLPDGRERTTLAELLSEERDRIRPPQRAKSTMEWSIEYVKAQAQRGQVLAADPAKANDFQLCLERTETRYAEFGASAENVLAAAHRRFAELNGFPPFEQWKSDQQVNPSIPTGPLTRLVDAAAEQIRTEHPEAS